MSENQLYISDPSVIAFYKKHNINHDIANKLLVELLEKIISESQDSMSSMISNEILNNIKILQINSDHTKSELYNLRELVLKMNNDISTTTFNRLLEIKQSYIDDLKCILNNNDATNTLKMSSLIEKENNIMIDKTMKIINETIPKSQNQYYTQIENLVKTFKDDINKQQSNITIDNISNILDTKYSFLLSSIKEPILNYINSSEEHITKNLNDIKNNELINRTSQNIINTKITEYITKFSHSSDKGALSESKLNYVIQTMFPSGEIINTSTEKSKCDLLLKRDGKKDILIENKDYKNNVPKHEINKFVFDVSEYNKTSHENANGLMISQNSGIANKKNYQIDIDGSYVTLYLHNCDYNTDKIQCAIDIIDHISTKLSELNIETNNSFTLSNQTLNNINLQYTQFINKKITLKNYIQDVNKKIFQQISDLELPDLSILLKKKFSTVFNSELTCNNCHKYNALNKKALSVHLRYCIKNNPPSNNISSDNITNIASDDIKNTSSSDDIHSDDNKSTTPLNKIKNKKHTPLKKNKIDI